MDGYRIPKGIEAFSSLIAEAMAASLASPPEKNAGRFAGIGKDSSDAERSASLKSVLEELAQSGGPDKLKADEYVEFFRRLYERDDAGSHFRHRYADICETIYSFFREDIDAYEEVPKAVVQLEDNMKYVVERFEETYEGTDELGSVIKLQDHISLEVIRLTHQTKLYREHCQQIGQLRVNVDETVGHLLENVRSTERKVKKMRKTADAMQRQYITILGILAAVVLAFNGGMTFGVTSINAVYGYHPFRIALIVFVVGFVLYNLLFALFTFLLRAVSDGPDECCEPDGAAAARTSPQGNSESDRSVAREYRLRINLLWGERGRAMLVIPNVILIGGIVCSFLLVTGAYNAVS